MRWDSVGKPLQRPNCTLLFCEHRLTKVLQLFTNISSPVKAVQCIMIVLQLCTLPPHRQSVALVS